MTGKRIAVLAVGTGNDDRVVLDLIVASQGFQIIGTVGPIKDRGLVSYFRDRDIPVFLSFADLPGGVQPQVVLDFGGESWRPGEMAFPDKVKRVDRQVLDLFKKLIRSAGNAPVMCHQDWLQELYRQSRDGFVMVDMRGRFMECNPAFEELLGYRLSELRQMTLWDVTPEQWHAWERKEVIEKQLLPRGYSDLFEKEYRRRDSRIIPIEVQAYLIKDVLGSAKSVWGVVREITDRKQSQQELKESEEKYRTVIEQTGQMVYDYDVKSGKIFWSGAVQQISGFALGEINPGDIQSWAGRLHPEDKDRVMSLLAEARARGGVFHVFYRFRKKDENYCYIEDQGVFLKDDDGESYRMLGAMSDMTERAVAEDTLKRNLADLQRFKKTTVDRELRMIELKKRVNSLNRELGRPAPFDLSFLNQPGSPEQESS